MQIKRLFVKLPPRVAGWPATRSRAAPLISARRFCRFFKSPKTVAKRRALDQTEVQPGTECLKRTTIAIHARKQAWMAFLFFGGALADFTPGGGDCAPILPLDISAKRLPLCWPAVSPRTKAVRRMRKAAAPGSVAACIRRLFNYSSDVFIKSPLRSDAIIAPNIHQGILSCHLSL